MIDRTHAGWRCHTQRLIRTVKGDLPRGSQGTIVYETENLGRQLIFVSWDTGIAVPVFPDEIEWEAQCHAPVQ
ncbi:MAG TPA: hypothetical protein VKJ47_13740 [Candidatus Binatia bacterium]|nr:hypothetical protein [Candidatus Binatia bacterium]